jgi:CHAT domain-containing protein
LVHFATHAFVDTADPRRSALVLSLVDERGSPRDGYLRLRDLYNLRLDADLVVLSACRTALGKDIRGEGLMALTRGFMYSGAPRVAASLWSLDDEATAALMSRFYRKVAKEGLRPAAALRAAQNEMRREDAARGWNDPYYWAPFQIQGEYR